MKKSQLFLLVFFCLPISVWAQKTINLNDGSAGFQSKSKIMSVQANISSEYLKEAKEARFFEINPVLQRAESVNVGDRVNLQLFEGKNYTATVSNIVTDVNGTLALTLQLSGYPAGFAIITTSTEGKSLVTVSIPELGQSFGSRYNVNSSVNYLIEIDESKVERPPLEDDEITVPEAIEILENEGLQNVENLASQLKNSQAADCGPTYSTNTGSDAIISLLVVYTPAAAATSYASQHGGINNVIASMIALGNTCLSNSQTGITLTLAHSAQVSYTEDNVMTTSLSRLQNSSDGYMDNVHALRKQYSAALVQLLTTDNDSGGYGYVLTNTSGDFNYAFSVCNVKQIGDDYPTSVHEIGHNMGLGHGAQQFVVSGGIFPYSYGWTWTGTAVNPYGTHKYCSVMSYWGGEYYADNIAGYNVPYFSNPDVTYLGQPTGHATQADAARSLREMKHVIAFFSVRGSNLPDAPANFKINAVSCNGFSASWSPVNDASKYQFCFRRSDASSTSWTYDNITDASFTINNSLDYFVTGVEYACWVIAFNACGDGGAKSAEITFTPACTESDGVPANFKINSVSCNGFSASWSPVNDASKYQFCFRRSDASPTSWRYYDNITDASFTINNSPAYFVTGVEYTCWVKAVNAYGDGTKSAEVTFKPACTVSSISVFPSSVFVVQGQTQIFSATVNGTGTPVQTVTWSVSGGSLSAISPDGLLTVTPNETANSLTVKATSVAEPLKSGTATALVITPPTYRLTVNNGTGSGNYTSETVVPVSARTPPNGQVFDRWTVDVYGVADINAASTTFTMGTSAATVTATYKPDIIDGNETVEPSNVKVYGMRTSLVAESDVAIKSVAVYNLLGHVVRHEQVNNTGVRIDNLPKGILIVAVTLQGEKIEIRKVFIY